MVCSRTCYCFVLLAIGIGATKASVSRPREGLPEVCLTTRASVCVKYFRCCPASRSRELPACSVLTPNDRGGCLIARSSELLPRCFNAHPGLMRRPCFPSQRPGSLPRPARCWGAYGTPPAALALQHSQEQQRQLQQGSRELPLGVVSSRVQLPAAVRCAGGGRPCAGAAASPAVAAAGEGAEKTGRAGIGRVVLALSSGASGGGGEVGV